MKQKPKNHAITCRVHAQEYTAILNHMQSHNIPFSSATDVVDWMIGEVIARHDLIPLDYAQTVEVMDRLQISSRQVRLGAGRKGNGQLQDVAQEALKVEGVVNAEMDEITRLAHQTMQED